MTQHDEPTLAIIFNERTGPELVTDIIRRDHAFCGFDTYETDDEEGRRAWLLVVHCETATAEELFSMIGSRLPDYVRARRFPPSRLRRLIAEAGPGL